MTGFSHYTRLFTLFGGLSTEMTGFSHYTRLFTLFGGLSTEMTGFSHYTCLFYDQWNRNTLNGLI